MAVLTQAQTLIRRPQARPRALTSVWVTAREAFWIALETLRTHKLRSFLTLLGVVISTTTLIVVMSIINGMNKYIADRIANLGANVFVVSQYSWTNNDEEWLRQRRRNKPIRVDDYEFLKENLHGYKSIGAAAWLWPRPTVKYNGHSLYDLNVTGQTPSMVGMQQEQVEFGRYFTESEYDHAAQVCFIGQDITDEFFPTVDISRGRRGQAHWQDPGSEPGRFRPDAFDRLCQALYGASAHERHDPGLERAADGGAAGRSPGRDAGPPPSSL